MTQRAAELIHAGFSDVLVEAAAACTTWIVWHELISGSERELVNNGTVFFIDAGNGPLGVTAAHVITALEHDKQRHSELVCQVGYCLLDPSLRIIDLYEDLDIAVF